MTWLDTTGLPPPRGGGAWHETRWLVGRNPFVARLVERVGAVDVDEDGWWVDVNTLRLTVRGVDAYLRAWNDYEAAHPSPRSRYDDDDTARYDVWVSAGPRADTYGPKPGMVHAFAVMSGTEQARLRLLATVGTERVEFCTDDLTGWDHEGRCFLQDWVALL